MGSLDRGLRGSVCREDIVGAALVLALEVAGPRCGSVSECRVWSGDTGSSGPVLGCRKVVVGSLGASW